MAEPLLLHAEVPVTLQSEAAEGDGGFSIELFRALHVSRHGWYTDPMGVRLFDGDKVAYFLDNHDPNLKLGVAQLETTPDAARLVNGRWFTTDYAQQVRRECLEAQAAGMTIKASVGMLVEFEDVELVESAEGLVVPFADMEPPFEYIKRAVVTEGSRVIAGAHPSARLRAAGMQPEDKQVRDWYKRAFAGATLERETQMTTEFKATEESGELSGGVRLELTAEAKTELAREVAGLVVPAVVEGVVPRIAADFAAALSAAFDAAEEAEAGGEQVAAAAPAVADDTTGIDLLAFQEASLHQPLGKVRSDADGHTGPPPVP